MVAQDVVKASIRWQVGDGSSVQIWLDKWLPTHSTFRVTSPTGTLPLDSQVCNLIGDDIGEWKANMIWQHFLPVDVDAILGIPRSRNPTRDRIIWAYTSRGIFTVNSAYKAALSLSSHAPRPMDLTIPISGAQFGPSTFQTKSRPLHGRQAAMHYQLKWTSVIVEF